MHWPNLADELALRKLEERPIQRARALLLLARECLLENAGRVKHVHGIQVMSAVDGDDRAHHVPRAALAREQQQSAHQISSIRVAPPAPSKCSRGQSS